MNTTAGPGPAPSGATNVTPSTAGHTPRKKSWWWSSTMIWVYGLVVLSGILSSIYLTILSPYLHSIKKKIEIVDSVESLREDVHTNAIIQRQMKYWQEYQATNLVVLSTNIGELREMVSGVMTTVMAHERARQRESEQLRNDLGHLKTDVNTRIEGLHAYAVTNSAANDLRLNKLETNSAAAFSELRKQFAMLQRATSNDLRLVEQVVPAAASTNIQESLASMRQQIIDDVNKIVAGLKVPLTPTNPADDHIVVSMLPDQSPSKKVAAKTAKKAKVVAEPADGYYYVTNYIVVPPQKVAEIPHVRGVQIQAMFMPQDAGWWDTNPGNPDKGEPYKVSSSREDGMTPLNVMIVRWSKKAPPHPKLIYSLKDYAVSWPDAPSTNPAHTQAGVRN